ncbi:hypothetical protein [Brevibacterium zhoupengii]|uniref:hypothetical protein n=1 Tax=Brevibacterium zhoupengii TaxID=2898795 RepID=UPI001E366E5B|nr:hypothetical protein [Brevibacterium zhoupengii]
MPDLKLFHFDIPTWGNYGDKALFPVVRDAFRVMGSGGPAGSGGSGKSSTEVDFTSAAALRREVDLALVQRINSSADAVVIGGGGLFLQDTNPNRLSGWQWKISAETLAAIEVPLIIYALGDNRFPGQPEFDDLMRSHVSQVLDQSVFFGLRNIGSIDTMTKFVGAGGGDLGTGGGDAEGSGASAGSRTGVPSRTDSIRFQPCPTTIAGLLYEPLRDRRPDPREKVLAIQMLVHPRQQAAGYDAEVIHQATIDAARMLVAKDWTVLSVPFHPDDAEVSRQMVAEVPEVEEIRLYGADVGFFAGFDLFASIPYVLGGRGHAQMIPFGVGSIPISLDLHAKLGYFATDIGHSEFVVPVGPEGLSSERRGGEGTAATDSVALRAHALAERIVETIEAAYAEGNDLQGDLLTTRQDLFDTTRENHLAIAEALRSRSGAVAPATGGRLVGDERTRTVSEIRAEEFHLAAVAEAEEFSAAQTRLLSKTRRDHRQQLEDATAMRSRVETERDDLRSELNQTSQRLNRRSEELEDRTAEVKRATEESAERQLRLDEALSQLKSVNDRTALAEAKVLTGKVGHGLTWRAKRVTTGIRRLRDSRR